MQEFMGLLACLDISLMYKATNLFFLLERKRYKGAQQDRHAEGRKQRLATAGTTAQQRMTTIKQLANTIHIKKY